MSASILHILTPPLAQQQRFTLADARAVDASWIHAVFQDRAHQAPFTVRLRRTEPGQRSFASAGPLQLTLDANPRPADGVEAFVRELAGQIRRQLHGCDPAQVDALFATPSNPYAKRHGSIPAYRRVDLRVGHMCNEKCVFCTDVDQRGRAFFRPAAEWGERLAEMRERGAESVLVVGNEPTLRPDLPDILAHAKRLGYKEIELSTNAVRLSDRAYFQELLDAGLNTLAMSVHGFDEASEGINTGRPDLVKRRRQALQNFAELVGDRQEQARKGIFLVTTTVITKHNVAMLPQIVDYLDGWQATYMLLHYPWITGSADAAFVDVVPDYPSVMRAVAPLLERLADPLGGVLLANLPQCVAQGLPSGRTDQKQILLPLAPSDESVLVQAFADKVVPMDHTLVHVAACETCSFRQRCGGVPSQYIERFGDLGLQAIP